jgi:hypothetical protein
MTHPVAGFVDGIINGELRGWLLDRKRLQHKAQVFCRFPSGRSLAFSSLWYRPDVADAEHVAGVFGFAIPVDLLTPWGNVCDVIDNMQFLLSNGANISLPTAPSVAPSVAPSGPINIFVHIPKTAGTSLRSNLLGEVPPGEKALIYPGDPGVSEIRFHQIPFYQRNRLRWIFGHVQVGIDRYLSGSSRYITFIREPLARLRSNLNHHLVNETDFKFNGVRLRTSTVLNEGLSEEFDNVMTRAIAGLGSQQVPLGQLNESHVEIAMSNVSRLFSFVGQQSNGMHDLNILRSHLELPSKQLSLENFTAPLLPHHDLEIARVDWERVGLRNFADRLLYERLLDEGLVSRILPNAASQI